MLRCHLCPEYWVAARVDSDGSLAAEYLLVGRMVLCFEPDAALPPNKGDPLVHGRATIWYDHQEGEDRTNYSAFTLPELTPAIASYWVERLKTFDLFS